MTGVPASDLPATSSLEQVALRLSRQSRLVVVVMLLWFLAAVTSGWRPTPDSALYLMLGQSLAQGHGYSLSGMPESAVPPGYPVLLAAMERAGCGSMVCLNLAMGVIGLLSVWMSYKLLSEIASRSVSLLVGGLIGLNALLHLISARQLSDMPFTLLALVGLYGLLRGLRGQRWALELGTLAVIASCWVRVTGFPLAAACLIGMLVQPRTASRLRVAGNASALLGGLLATAGVFYAHYQYCQQAQPPLPTIVQASSPPAAEVSPELFNQNSSAPDRPATPSPIQEMLPTSANTSESASTLAPISYLPLVQQLLSHPAHLLKNAYQSAPLFSVFFSGQEMPVTIAHVAFVLPLLVGLWHGFSRGQYLMILAVIGYTGGVVAALPSDARYLLPLGPLLLLYYFEGLSLLLDWRTALRPHAVRLLLVYVVSLAAFNAAKGAGAVYKDSRVIAHRTAELNGPVQLLQAYAQPGEQLVSSDKERELAYLSGVPYAPLDRGALVSKLPQSEYLRFVFERGLRFVVISDDRARSMPDFDVFRDAVSDRRMFEPIGISGHFRLYRFRAPPLLPPALVSQPAPTAVAAGTSGTKSAN